MNRIVLVLLCALLGACAPEESVETEDTVESMAVDFTDVTQEAGLGDFQHETGAFGEIWFPETMGAGGGFFDYDNDGWLDIVLVSGGAFPSRLEDLGPALRLYHNQRDGSFADITDKVGLGGLRAYAFGVTMADIDNDGDQEIFVTTLGENLLLQNEEGMFRETFLAEEAQWSSAAVFLDADRDGFLDLYVGNYVDWSPEKDIVCTRVGNTKSYCTPELYEGLSGRFYHNNGDGTFADWTEVAGFTEAPGKTLGAIAVDYNRDTWPDLVIANDTQRDLLYENQGDGTFEEKGIYSGIAFDENGRARAGMGIDAGVIDSSGEVTIMVGHFSGEMVGVYRHSQNGFFVDRAAVSQIGRPSLRMLTFGLFLFDADLDADLDLLAANGHITEDIEQVVEGIMYRQPPQLYLNQGGGRFSVASLSLPLSTGLVARGAAHGDYDRDGDMDVLITENGGPAHLWRNELSGGSHLTVQLEGVSSNRDGIGARVVLQLEGRDQQRYVRAGGSYLSHAPTEATFGLAGAVQVDSLWVYWPSGMVDRLGPVFADQRVTITEGRGQQ